jgi:hypothetical protein
MIAFSVNVEIMMTFVAATSEISRLEICKTHNSSGLFAWETFAVSIAKIVEIHFSVQSVRGKSQSFYTFFNTE